MKELTKEGNHVCFTLNAISALTLVILGAMYMVEEGFESTSTIVAIALGVIYGGFALLSYVKYRSERTERTE